MAHSVEDALGMAYDNGEEEAFIIGGGIIYRETQDLWDKVYLTEVDVAVAGDVFFPELDMKAWRETLREVHAPDEKNEWAYTFRVLERVEEPEEA